MNSYWLTLYTMQYLCSRSRRTIPKMEIRGLMKFLASEQFWLASCSPPKFLLIL